MGWMIARDEHDPARGCASVIAGDLATVWSAFVTDKGILGYGDHADRHRRQSRKQRAHSRFLRMKATTLARVTPSREYRRLRFS